MTFTISLTDDLDLPDGAVICLSSETFSACSPITPAAMASTNLASLARLSRVYQASFDDVPAGTYVLTIPPTGSFAGYSDIITVGHGMPGSLSILLEQDPVPGDATPIVSGPVPGGAGPGSSSPPDASRGTTGGSSAVVALPATGSGKPPATGVYLLALLGTCSLLILGFALRMSAIRTRP